MVISINHTTAQMGPIAFDGIKIADPPGSSIRTQYASLGVGAYGYPHIILIRDDKKVVSNDIWPISNTILRDELLAVGGIPQSCTPTTVAEAQAVAMQVFPNPANDFLYVQAVGNAHYRINSVLNKI